MRAERLAATSMVLGEGPIALGDGFACVDIRTGTIYEGSLDGDVAELHRLHDTVGAIAASTDDGLVAATGTALRTLGSARSTLLPTGPADLRLNDGKADPVGRFVGGTMADPPRAGAGALWSFASGTATRLLDHVTISNGLCWTADGTTMYYIDTPTQRVDAFDYDTETGAVSERRTILELADDAGAPDGMTIDADGGVWVALWGGGAVRRYLDGKLSEVVEVPTPFVTCPVFAGPNRSTLVITTSSEPNPGEPGAGDVYAVASPIRGGRDHVVDVDVVFADSRDR